MQFPIPSKIHEMLLSPDFEMNQLGALWINQNTSQDSWEEMLKHYCQNYTNPDDIPYFGITKRWSWDIIDGTIYLSKIPSLWEQLEDSTYRRTYTTTTFTLQTLQNAIQEYYKTK